VCNPARRGGDAKRGNQGPGKTRRTQKKRGRDYNSSEKGRSWNVAKDSSNPIEHQLNRKGLEGAADYKGRESDWAETMLGWLRYQRRKDEVAPALC